MKQRLTLFILIFLSILAASILPASTSFAQDALGGVDSLGLHDDSEDWADDDWDEVDTPIIKDPYEKYNRFIFQFNHKVYKYLLNPVSKVYDFVVPKKVQGSINNLSTTIQTPIRLFNSLFQGKFKGASIELRRFAINSTIGIGGLFDPAEAVFHLEEQDEDFDQTLGHHGVEMGPYIMWPIIGPSTRRATIAFPFDVALNPITWIGIYEVEPDDTFQILSGVRRANNYSYSVRDNYNLLVERAIDPYIALQHAYVENRRKKVKE